MMRLSADTTRFNFIQREYDWLRDFQHDYTYDKAARYESVAPMLYNKY